VKEPVTLRLSVGCSSQPTLFHESTENGLWSLASQTESINQSINQSIN